MQQEQQHFVDPLAGDEDLSFGVRIDYDKVDQPSKWDLVNDPANKPMKKAAMIRRILTPPKFMQAVWVPVVKKDDNGDEYAGYLKLRKDHRKKDTLLDAFRKAEQSSKGSGKDERLQFEPEDVWVYLVFCREDPVPEVRLAFYKPSIMKGIKEKQHQAHPTKPGILLYGPAILSDIIITKKFDPREKSQRKRTSYSVDWMPDNRWAGVVPTTFWNTGFQFKEGHDFVTDKIFTQDEMDAIQAFQAEHGVEKLNDYLEALVAPQSDEDVARLIKENPLNPWARNASGPVFPDPERFMKELVRLSIPCLTAPKDLSTKDDAPEEEKVPMPQTEDVPLPPEPQGHQEEPANNPFNDPAPAVQPKQQTARKAPAAKPDDKDAGGAW